MIVILIWFTFSSFLSTITIVDEQIRNRLVLTHYIVWALFPIWFTFCLIMRIYLKIKRNWPLRPLFKYTLWRLFQINITIIKK